METDRDTEPKMALQRESERPIETDSSTCGGGILGLFDLGLQRIDRVFGFSDLRLNCVREEDCWREGGGRRRRRSTIPAPELPRPSAFPFLATGGGVFTVTASSPLA